ncbi:hypothetical protein KOJCDNHJ_03028 [Xanthomonas citri pv. punicae]|nr:hypothetical protein KOJCDNHJ_03028 [Xanthomonas citri pv. punicae]
MSRAGSQAMPARAGRKRTRPIGKPRRVGSRCGRTAVIAYAGCVRRRPQDLEACRLWRQRGVDGIGRFPALKKSRKGSLGLGQRVFRRRNWIGGRNLQPWHGDAVAGGGRAGFLHRAVSGRTHHCPWRRHRGRVADGRRHCHGHRHLVDALRRHAGVPPADSGGLRPGADVLFDAGGDPDLGAGALANLAREPAVAPVGPGCAVDGAWHRADALHGHGCAAHGAGHSLRPAAVRAVDRHRRRRLRRRVVDRVPAAPRWATLQPAPDRRLDHGRGDRGHALHRHGRRPVRAR